MSVGCLKVPVDPLSEASAVACDSDPPRGLAGRFLCDPTSDVAADQTAAGPPRPTSASSGSSSRPIGRSATATSTSPTSARCRWRPTGASPRPTRRCRCKTERPHLHPGARRPRRRLAARRPADPADGRAWGGMLAELFAASIDASPVLQQTDRSALIKGAMVATTKQLDKQHPLRRSRRGARQPLPARRRRRHRHHRRAHRRQEDPDPRRAGRLAGGQGRRQAGRPDRRRSTASR